MNNNVWKDDLFNSLGENTLEELLKFHNKTIWINQGVSKSKMTRDLLKDLEKNQGDQADRTPYIYNDVVQFQDKHKNNPGSERNFLSTPISLSDIGSLLCTSFAGNQGGYSRRYPSAGALYPVSIIVYIFDSQESLKSGVYVFDTNKYELLRLDKVDVDSASLRKSINISYSKKLPSRYAIGYALNLKASIFKYGLRGYRHGLIEVGAACQAFRESCHELNFGEFCSSAFDDFELSFSSGLNIREFPIILLQWFGLRG